MVFFGGSGVFYFSYSGKPSKRMLLVILLPSCDPEATKPQAMAPLHHRDALSASTKKLYV